jgi:type I pantothenate kinase
MDQRADLELAPHRIFTRSEWAKLRADTPMTLTETEVERLQSLNDPISMDEVISIYLPISRLLSLYAGAVQGLHDVTKTFLGATDGKTPFVIGLAGSVAVGKSTTARVLRALLARWPNVPKVELVTTDGFLLPNAVLEREGLLERKGLPESYDVPALISFLGAIKAGRRHVTAPVYSHLEYDVTNERVEIDRPDILIIEGLNVLETPPAKAGHASGPFFRRFAALGNEEAVAMAEGIWERINLVNLREHILPTKPRADLILEKGPSHRVETVALRRL